MKQSGFPTGALAAVIVAVHLVLGAFFRYLVLPFLVPSGLVEDPAALDAFLLRAAIAGVVLGLFSFLACLLVFLALRRGEGKLPDFLDAIRVPFIVIDGEGRCLLLNTEAERVLGVSRGTDIGLPLAPDIRNALHGSTEAGGDPDPRCVVRRGDRHYHVLDHALPGGSGAGERVILMRNVTGRIRTKQALRDLTETIQALTDNTMRISSTSVSVSQGASRQASSLSAISASLDEFSKRIQGNTESAEKGTKLAAQAREAAEHSGNEIANALSAMTDVQDAGIRIARIVKLIDDIAFQTNLLALNAAVEAARAGRQGKGFAVVADEVRNLAGRSAKAAKDTAAMVEDVTERIGNASAFITKLEGMLRNIVQDAIRMADSSASATAMSAEQATAILHVNQELGQMNSVTQSTQTAAKESAAAVERLTEQVGTLKERLADLTREFREGRARAGASERAFRTEEPSGRSLPVSIDLTAEPEIYGADRPFTGFSVQRLPGEYGAEGLPEDGLRARLFGEPRAGGRKEETRTEEGDRIVQPGQSIALDDTEFGRY